MTPHPIVQVSNVTFGYHSPGNDIFENLALEIDAGSITAILGPNGSGKSTLLRLILGALRPQAGTISLAGYPQDEYSRRARSTLVGLVPQDEHVPFNFTVLDYVVLGRAPYLGPLQMPRQEDYQLATLALTQTGLSHLQSRQVPSLSGGERQLAKLTRALLQKPRILLLDEPTAHLDLSNTKRILSILRELAAEGTTLVLTTHDPNVASAVAASVVLLRAGRVIRAGPVSTVLTPEILTETFSVSVQVARIGDRRAILLDL